MTAKLKEKPSLKGSFKKSGKAPLNKSDFEDIKLTHKVNDLDNTITEFWFKPDKDIEICKVIISVGSFLDEITGEGNIIYNNSEWYLLAGYENVESNMLWNFRFFAKEKDSNKQLSLLINYKT